MDFLKETIDGLAGTTPEPHQLGTRNKTKQPRHEKLDTEYTAKKQEYFHEGRVCRKL